MLSHLGGQTRPRPLFDLKTFGNTLSLFDSIHHHSFFSIVHVPYVYPPCVHTLNEPDSCSLYLVCFKRTNAFVSVLYRTPLYGSHPAHTCVSSVLCVCFDGYRTFYIVTVNDDDVFVVGMTKKALDERVPIYTSLLCYQRPVSSPWYKIKFNIMLSRGLAEHTSTDNAPP